LAERDLREAGRDRDVRREAVALGNLGTCLHAVGDAQAALDNFERERPTKVLAQRLADGTGAACLTRRCRSDKLSQRRGSWGWSETCWTT
jgi:hypothetical protein